MIDPNATPETLNGDCYRHLKRMTDAVGLIQFSKIDLPDLGSGYTVDDNARALILALNSNHRSLEEYAIIYARFLYKAQRERGDWCNWLLPQRGLTADLDSEDCFGRAFAACCRGIGSESEEIKTLCLRMLRRALPYVDELRYPRALAYVLIGSRILIDSPEFAAWSRMIVRRLGGDLMRLYGRNATRGWRWFEGRLTYCNGILPQALLAYYDVDGEPEVIRAASDALLFLGDNLFSRGCLNIVGNRGWWPQGGQRAEFDQQPVDACSLYLAAGAAYRLTGRNDFLQMAELAYSWYDGKNILQLPLYNRETGGCHDGLHPEGLNLNQGAESLLSYLLSRETGKP